MLERVGHQRLMMVEKGVRLFINNVSENVVITLLKAPLRDIVEPINLQGCKDVRENVCMRIIAHFKDVI